MLQDSDFRAGCPIVALAVDGPDRIPDAAQLSQSSFQRMATTLIRLLREAGASQAQARPMANVAIAALEGAVILCRVERSTRPSTMSRTCSGLSWPCCRSRIPP